MKDVVMSKPLGELSPMRRLSYAGSTQQSKTIMEGGDTK